MYKVKYNEMFNWVYIVDGAGMIVMSGYRGDLEAARRDCEMLNSN